MFNPRVLWLSCFLFVFFLCIVDYRALFSLASLISSFLARNTTFEESVHWCCCCRCCELTQKCWIYTCCLSSKRYSHSVISYLLVLKWRFWLVSSWWSIPKCNKNQTKIRKRFNDSTRTLWPIFFKRSKDHERPLWRKCRDLLVVFGGRRSHNSELCQKMEKRWHQQIALRSSMIV